MATGKKRSRKGRIIPSDEENSFVNNSDYITPESKNNSIDEESHEASFNDSLPFNPISNSLPGGNINDDRSTSANPDPEADESKNSAELSSKNLDEGDGTDFDDAKSEFDNDDKNSMAKAVSTVLSSPSSVPKAETTSQAPILSEPLEQSTSVPSTSDSKQTLSYSQQQSVMNLQSPSKRRETAASQVTVKKNEPRLVINKLTLTNFKSYAGRQEIGPFNASFSAVVGPNGSGKSNVIDSMLFVFGFRALKMRQGKLSELIHNSSGGQKLDFCQVDIHFMQVIDDDIDESKAHPIPNSELIISRRATKNNSSQYFINGQTSNYTNVTTYLKGQGIDLDHKRFLILQGEVESIAQMKAKAERDNDDGLLEYLEDIIGTTHYKQLIEDNLLKIDELNEVCLEKENRFVLVEKDKNLLEDKKVEALRFLEMEKILINKQSIKYQTSINEHKNILEKNSAIVEELNEKLDEEIEKNKELNKGVEELNKQKKQVQQEISTLVEHFQSASSQQKAVNKANVALEEKIKNLLNKTKKMEKSKQLLEQTLSSSKQKLENNTSASLQYKNELDEHVKNLETEKQKLDEMRRNLTHKTSDFTKQIQFLQRKLEPWNDKIKDKESAIQITNSSIEMLSNQKESFTKQLSDSKQKLLDIKSEGKQKEAEFRSAENKLAHITDQLQLGQEQCQHEKKQLEARRSQLYSARQKTQDAVSSLSKAQNKNKVLSSLSRLAKSGRIEGFYGRLGDLGQIDDKYDVAISTACPALDSMVVETVETAQTCIDYLRKNRLGYANFICLNKLRKFNLNPIQTPGNPATVRRLFDLINPLDEKFLPAFYSKLYDTLVASNLNEARSVAYGKSKRFRVVTLDGKVVDTSGTMSGGGNYLARGGMKLSSSATSDSFDYSEEEVENMRQELNELESKFELSNATYQEKEMNLRKLNDLKPETENNISRLRLDIEALASEKKEVLRSCKALIAESENSNATQQLEDQISVKTKEVELLNNEKQSLRSEMSDLESQIKDLEEKILEAGGVELRVQNSKVDSIKQNIEIINEKTSNDVMAIKKLENEINRHTKIIAKSEEELKSAEYELSEIKSFQEEKNHELEELNSKLAEVTNEKEEKEEQLETIKSELDERNQQINDFKSKQIEIENKLEKYNSIVKRCQRQLEENNQDLEALIIRDVTDYIDWLEEEEQGKYNGSEIEKLDEEQLEEINQDEIEPDIENIENYMSTVKVDIEVLKEYGSKKKEFESRRLDLNEAIEKRDEIRNYCEELKRKRLDEFMEGFNTISMSLKEMYQMITMGGNAELELVDSLDPFSEGILFSVMPPKKSWKNISNLSGGEKTLSSLALVFALHKYKPTPLYVMDEIDAALDFRNVSIVANYIKQRTKNAQFVVISLRNNMFELAQQLVGIYKINNMTKSISLQNKDFLSNENDDSK